MPLISSSGSPRGVSWFSSFSCSRRQVLCEQLLEGPMLRVPAECNSQAWRILSVGPAFPKYLLHSVDGWSLCCPSCPAPPGPACQGSVVVSDSTRPLLQSCHCITALLPSHSGACSFAFWLKCPEQCLWERGAWSGHGSSLEVCFLGCASSVAKDAMAAVGMEQSCTKLFGGDDRGVFQDTQGSLGLC